MTEKDGGLPDPSALEKSATAANEEDCQRLILLALDHGTYTNGDDDAIPLSKRIQETVQWFELSLSPILKDAPKQLLVEDALVDCLWLLGSTLTSLPWESNGPSDTKTNAESPSKSSQNQTFHPSLRALVVIVRALLSSEAFSSATLNSDGEDDMDVASSKKTFCRKLQENWFPSLLEAVDAIRLGNTTSSDPGKADDLMKRLRQYNTTCNYKQQKYNLLQEESEGYSKVLKYLSSWSKETHTSDKHLTTLWQLVGTFELDPNRVLDLVLEVLESKLKQSTESKVPSGYIVQRTGHRLPTKTNEIRWLLGIIEESSSDKLPALLRFKLENASLKFTASSKVSYILESIALLIQENLLDLSAFVFGCYDVTGFSSDLEAAYTVYRKKERDRILALTRVSLSGNTTSGETPKQTELRKQLQQAMEKLRLLEDMEPPGIQNESSTTDLSTSITNNGTILSLYRILIQWGEWERVKPMLSTTEWSKLCCILPESFGSSLVDVAEDSTVEWIESVIENDNSSDCYFEIPKLNQEAINIGSYRRNSKRIRIEKDLCLLEFVRSVSDPLNCVLQSGCILSRPVFYCRLCRTLRYFLSKEIKASNSKNLSQIPTEVFDFLNIFFVPSLSLFSSNPALSTEVWTVLKLLEYDLRYKLYEGWKGPGLEKAGLKMGSPKPLSMIEAELLAGRAARYSLKRLSKDNIRDMSRQLAKVTHSNPLVVFASILSQIESYDNMVEVMVEAQRFVNPLGLDVLGHCILGRLSGSTGGGLMINRSRLKADGVNVSQWLQSLEAFAGEFYKARPVVEFRGILFYLMERLKGGNVMELGMLRTMLKVAGGYSFADYSPAASLNERQLQGRSGSVALKRETMSFGIVEKTNALATQNIRSILQEDGLGVTLLILIAQARDRIIFDSGKEAFKDVKLVGNLHDTCQVVMSILLEFLTDNNQESNKTEAKQGSEPFDNISMYSKYLPSFSDLQENYGLDMVTAWHLCRPSVKAALEIGSNELESPSLKRFELTGDVRKSYAKFLPDPVWNFLSPKLFEVFYMNTLADIVCPDDLYSSESSRVGEEIKRIEGLKPPVPRDDTKSLERLKGVSMRLDGDQEIQTKRVDLTLKDLNEEKTKFFVSEIISKESSKSFLIYCTYPRTMQSPDDAMYSSAFAFRLHKIWTPGFSIMHYLDELISVVSGSLFGLTEAEAANVAILLWQSLKVVNRWRFEDGLFDKEVLGKPGSYIENNGDDETSSNPVSYKEFIDMYNKWQYSLAAALIGCLNSTEYIHIRTGLVVLSRLVEVFPTGPTLGNKLLKTLEPLQDENKSRPDIRASANAYGMMLLKARDEGKWVEEDEASAKARAEKEKLAAEERKKKIEKSFKELERDNQKIDEQIGTDDRRDRDRSRGASIRENTRGDLRRDATGGTNRPNTDYLRPENDRRGDRRADDRDWRREGERNTRERNDEDERTRGRRISNGDDDRRGNREIRDGRGGRDEGRWRRDRETPSTRNAKRSREPSPVDDRDMDRSNPKRPRVDRERDDFDYSSRRGASNRSPEPSSRGATRSSRRNNTRR